jgi:hypothetical protein
MTQHDAESWRKAVGARQDLVAKYLGDPAVTLIDIGYPPQDCEHADQLVVRIHVTEQWSASHANGCTTSKRGADDIPVCVVRKA